MRFVIFLYVVLFAITINNSWAAEETQPKTVATNAKWSAYTFTENKQKVCYMVGSPEKSEGEYTKRGDVLLFITHYPDLNVFDDLYFDMGYAVKKNVEATVALKDKNYELTGDKTHLFSKTRDEDKKLIEAIKKNDAMIVKSTSNRGKKSTDTFNLKGFTKTYQAMTKACKKGAKSK